jgi:prepilin-type N-terminal cleavage/methylation domain-containing protein/prepilin-type processing-associated H-X9-DG protein
MKLHPATAADRGQAVSGFTLIELLVVIAIISLLIAMLNPLLIQARQQAMSIKCAANMRSVGMFMFNYAADFKDWGPSRTTTWPNAYHDDGGWVQDYVTDARMFLCPTDEGTDTSSTPIGGTICTDGFCASYYMLFGLGVHLGATNNEDTFYGWRNYGGTETPAPNLNFMGKTIRYVNHRVGSPQIFNRVLAAPSNQALGVDAWYPTDVTFYAMGSSSSHKLAGTNIRGMHRLTDRINVLYGDGHVKAVPKAEATLRWKTTEGHSLSLYW